MTLYRQGRSALTATLATSLLLTGLTACGGAQPTESAVPAPAPVVTPPSPPPAPTPVPVPVPDPLPPPSAAKGVDKAVVLAVIDSNINPYHWDYLAAKMPQALNSDPSDDLPLFEDPATWLPGHPGAAAFKSYQALNLTIDPTDPAANTAALATADAAEWGKINYSEGTANSDVNLYWFPGTKIIGHVAFSGGFVGDPITSLALGRSTGPVNTFATTSHGIGTSSVSAGNIHGSCPNCLIVYVHGTSEQANEWVQQQDWIDLQTNSWGISTVYRERAYAGSNTETQRQAVERGQQIFFSAGNGQENAYVAPNATLQSSQEGPDWIVTVGATDSVDNSSPTGHGKPTDIASVGDSYPSASGNDGTANGAGTFGGTSNATPVIAGIYAEVLYRLRRDWATAPRQQVDGVIATGPSGCKEANANCALADGQLTVHELRNALYRSATYSETGVNVGGLGGITTIPFSQNVAELELMSEGHGNYRGRMDGDETYEAEISRILGYVDGSWFAEQDADQLAWMNALSYCTQQVWGSWDFGYFKAEDGLPDFTDPLWPVRNFLVVGCPPVIGALVEAEQAYISAFR